MTDTRQALFDCDIQPRPLDYPLAAYHRAVIDGPLHYQWEDKPHRLLYDLIAAVKFYAALASAQPVAGAVEPTMPQWPDGPVKEQTIGEAFKAWRNTQAAPSTPPHAVVEAVPSLHPATADLVRRFSQALAEKLAAAEAKYGYSDGWAFPDWMDECRAKLIEHIAKGDPRDVAAYCAFLWHHGASTAPVL